MIRITEIKKETLKNETSKCGELTFQKDIRFFGILIFRHNYDFSAVMAPQENKKFGFNHIK
jgi:hypothetical protein